jgi:hypothetical protein
MSISIKSQEDFNECLMYVSDLYKDAYGFRPRGYNFSEFSFGELEKFMNDICVTIEEEVAYEKEMENKAIKDVMSMGVDRETALRWLDQADAYFMYGDDEFYQDSIDKYGWVSRCMEDNRNLKRVA